MDHDQFCAQAWDTHADQPDAVAQRLPAGAALVQTPAQAAAQARLAAHVLGEHLGRWPAALAQLQPLQALADPDPSARASVQRQRLALCWAAGDRSALTAAGLPHGEHIATLALAGSLASVTDPDTGWAAFGAAQALEAAQPLPDADPAVRALAANANNIAANLEERAGRLPAHTEAMLAAAAAALQHWARAGTWLEVERAHWRLARCHLAAGDAARAAGAATDGLAVCQANDAPAFERFFLHALLARAARTAGDSAALSTHRDAALAAWQRVPADERVWCETDMESLR